MARSPRPPRAQGSQPEPSEPPKPKAAKRAPSEPALPDVPEPEASDADLTLQLEAPEAPQGLAPPPRKGPRRKVESVDGKPIHFDTSHLIPLAGIVAVVVLVYGVYAIFKPTGAPSAPPPLPPPNAPGPAASKPSEPTPNYASDPANKKAYHAYVRFVRRAYKESLNDSAEKLIPRFHQDVSLYGVGDPLIRDLHAKFLENLSIYPEAPLLSVGTVSFSKDGPVSRGRDDPRDAKRKRDLAYAIKKLTNTLSERYGLPPEEPRAAPAPAPAPPPAAPEAPAAPAPPLPEGP